MINCAVLHPNEVEIIFGDQNGLIKVWDLQIQKVKQFWQMNVSSVSITALQISQDATKLIMGNSVGSFFFWESNGAKVVNKEIKLSESQGGQSLRGNVQGSISSSQYMSYGSTEEFNPMQEIEAHPDQYILKCKISQNKEFLATCSSDKSCKIWKFNNDCEEYEYY